MLKFHEAKALVAEIPGLVSAFWTCVMLVPKDLEVLLHVLLLILSSNLQGAPYAYLLQAAHQDSIATAVYLSDRTYGEARVALSHLVTRLADGDLKAEDIPNLSVSDWGVQLDKVQSVDTAHRVALLLIYWSRGLVSSFSVIGRPPSYSHPALRLFSSTEGEREGKLECQPVQCLEPLGPGLARDLS